MPNVSGAGAGVADASAAGVLAGERAAGAPPPHPAIAAQRTAMVKDRRPLTAGERKHAIRRRTEPRTAQIQSWVLGLSPGPASLTSFSDMDVLRAAGVRPVARATAAGVAAALLALFVLLRGLIGVLDPVEPEVTQVGAGLLIVFIAATLGGVTGAWQAALAGARNRREIVLVGAAGPGAVCALVSLTLSIATPSTRPARCSSSSPSQPGRSPGHGSSPTSR